MGWKEILKSYIENPKGVRINLEVPNDEAHSWRDIVANEIKFEIKGEDSWNIYELVGKEEDNSWAREIDITLYPESGIIRDRHIRKNLVKDWIEPKLKELGFKVKGKFHYEHPDWSGFIKFTDKSRKRMAAQG